MDDIPTGLKNRTPETTVKRPSPPLLSQEPGSVGHAVTWHQRTEAVGRAVKTRELLAVVFFKASGFKGLKNPATRRV
jgi:hypothetical protein